MFFRKSPVILSGFVKKEFIKIKANSLFEASVKFGQAVALPTKKVLKSLRNEHRQYKEQAQKSLSAFETIASRGELVVDGVNYAQRYLDALKGFSEGVGISEVEAAFLQMEIEAGCQTIIVQDKKTFSTAIIHTEENASDNNLPDGEYNYKVVKMILPDREVVFFAYPGVCGWGPAFAIDKTKQFVQVIDDLFIRDVSSHGNIFANAVAFMLFDARSKSTIKKLTKKLTKVIEREGCIFGYAVHLASAREKYFESIEFGDSTLVTIKPDKDSKHLFVTQPNYPRSKKIGQFSSVTIPKNRKRWDIADKHLYLEMKRRRDRLVKVYKNTTWDFSSGKAVIKTGLQVLAYPYADLRRYMGKKGKWIYYHTGISSMWNASHFVGYLSEGKCEFYVGKYNAKPIEGMEYSINVDENYKYKEKNLWEEVKKLK